MSSESGEVSCVLSESGEISCAPSKSEKISHNEPSEGGEISHVSLEGGENYQFCVVTVLGLALKPGGLAPPEVINYTNESEE